MPNTRTKTSPASAATPAPARKRSSRQPGTPAAQAAPAKSLAPRRTPSQLRGQATVEALLQAASREIAEGGLDRLTTKRIAAAADMSVGGVYGYFPNKEAIVTALIERWNQRVFAAVDGVHPRFAPGLDLLTYLNHQIDRAAQVYEEQPGLGAMFDMLPAMPAVGEAIERHDAAVGESLRSALRHYLPSTDIREIDAAAQAIPAVCHEIMLLALRASADGHQRLIKVLRACVMAIGSRLLLA